MNKVSKVFIVILWTDRVPSGGNRRVCFRALPPGRGTDQPLEVAAIRQAGLGLWAFPQRPGIEREDGGREWCRALDRALSEAWELAQEPRCTACGEVGSECGCEPAGKFE